MNVRAWTISWLSASVCILGAAARVHGQDGVAQPAAAVGCTIDLALPGSMKDIVSNALTRGCNKPEADVDGFLRGAETRFATGQELLLAAAHRFGVETTELAAEVERFRHCNCSHPGGELAQDAVDAGPETVVSAFARDVLLHVVLHELGHALVREFDLPVLGNEETAADAFATHFLVSQLPERAPAVLLARVASLLHEAGEVPRAQWTMGGRPTSPPIAPPLQRMEPGSTAERRVHGEHDNDARRAFQVAALAVAADREKYAEVASVAGLRARDVQRAQDYGAEIHRSWRRVLAPLCMPAGQRSSEARVVGDDSDPLFGQLRALGFVAELEAIVGRFDWHSQVTVRFVPGEGGAAWSRSSRTVTVHADYLRRFVRQGEAAGR